MIRLNKTPETDEALDAEIRRVEDLAVRGERCPDGRLCSGLEVLDVFDYAALIKERYRRRATERPLEIVWVRPHTGRAARIDRDPGAALEALAAGLYPLIDGEVQPVSKATRDLAAGLLRELGL